MCAKAWREFDELLINKVQEFPYLYNYRMREFRNYAAKQSAWGKIAEELGSEGNHCQRRWRLIRDSYVRFKRDQGTPVGVSYTKKEKNPLMDNLNFLDAFVKHRSIKTEVAMDEANCTAECDEGFGQEHMGTSFSMGSDNDDNSFGSSGAHYSAFAGNSLPIVCKSEYFISSCKPEGDDVDHRIHLSSPKVNEVARSDEELECFVRSVFGTLHRFTPKQRAVAKVRIQQMLLEIEFGEEALSSLTRANT